MLEPTLRTPKTLEELLKTPQVPPKSLKDLPKCSDPPQEPPKPSKSTPKPLKCSPKPSDPFQDIPPEQHPAAYQGCDVPVRDVIGVLLPARRQG